MCFQMITGTRVPEATAASTYGCSRSDSTTPRTRRETRGNSAMLIATITFSTDARVSAMSAIARRIGGIDISPSITRITTASSTRTKPATRPMNVPEDRGTGRHREPDQQRHPRAVQDAGIDVAPEHVGAEPVEFGGRTGAPGRGASAVGSLVNRNGAKIAIRIINPTSVPPITIVGWR